MQIVSIWCVNLSSGLICALHWLILFSSTNLFVAFCSRFPTFGFPCIFNAIIGFSFCEHSTIFTVIYSARLSPRSSNNVKLELFGTTSSGESKIKSNLSIWSEESCSQIRSKAYNDCLLKSEIRVSGLTSMTFRSTASCCPLACRWRQVGVFAVSVSSCIRSIFFN